MEPPRHLGGYIHAISNAMALSMQQNMAALGLTHSQGRFLSHLWVRQERLGLMTCAKDLEQFFDIRHSTVSGILSRMEAAGFVTVAPSPEDHRCKYIHLTPKALAAGTQVQSFLEANEARLVQNMTVSEAQSFRRLLALAADNMGVCTPIPPISYHKEESNL